MSSLCLIYMLMEAKKKTNARGYYIFINYVHSISICSYRDVILRSRACNVASTSNRNGMKLYGSGINIELQG